VQADAGLVEDEERVHQRGAEAGGEVNALNLAAGEGFGAAVEREVAEADLLQVTEARADRIEGEVGAVGAALSLELRAWSLDQQLDQFGDW
jgi:hypothetical protein